MSSLIIENLKSDPMKIRLMHMPQKFEGDSPRAGEMFIYIMAMGLFSLASELKKAGHDVEIVHAGMEFLADPAFDLKKYFIKENPDLLIFSLNWHPQIFETIEAARAAKRVLPGVKTAFGGFTASVFAEELLEDFSESVDFIISGDGELPLVELAQKLSKGEEPEGVPNLFFRKDGKAQSPATYWCPSEPEFSSYDFADFSLLRRAESFSAPYIVPPGSTLQSIAGHDVFYLATSRGCTVNCSFCGGGKNAHGQYFKRSEPIFRNPEAVLHSVAQALDHGMRSVYICFEMPHARQDYYADLFDAMAREFGSGRIRMLFESSVLPDKRFIESFAHAFDLSGSQYILSPTSCQEHLRKRFLGSFYSNAELEKSLAALESAAIETLLYFSIMPGQSLDQTKEMIRWQTHLRNRYSALIQTMPIELEPGAPWALEPDKFGLRILRKSARDYYLHHKALSCEKIDIQRQVGIDDDALIKSWRFFEEFERRRSQA